MRSRPGRWLLPIALLTACAAPVRVEVARGAAPEDARVRVVVYESDASCGEPGALASARVVYDHELPGPAIGDRLGDRRYVVVATARDRASCEVRWRGCAAVHGRSRDPVRVALAAAEPVERCAADDRCDMDGRCVPAPALDGGLDASVVLPDAAPIDGATDAGPDAAPIDAATDAGPDDAGGVVVEGCADDDFERAELGPAWTVEPAMTAARVEILGGRVLVEPEAGGWYNMTTGLFVRRTAAIEGDFLLESDVEVTRRIEPEGWPTLFYNTVGLVMRRTEATDVWALVDFGRQSDMNGALGKRTIGGGSTLSPTITTATRTARLRLCRVADQVASYVRLAGTTEWVEVQSHRRVEFRGEVQIGIMSTGWNATGNTPNTSVEPEVRGLVGSFACRRIASIDECASP